MGVIDKLNHFASFKDTDIFQPGQFNPGLFDVNRKKVKKLYPYSTSLNVMLNGPAAERIDGIIKQMNDGDLSTGIVMSMEPLLVACFSQDFDAVALYCYPTELGTKMGWSAGRRLLTVNWYDGYGKMKKNKDIDRGPVAMINSKHLVLWSQNFILITANALPERNLKFRKKCGSTPKPLADNIWQLIRG